MTASTTRYRARRLAPPSALAGALVVAFALTGCSGGGSPREPSAPVVANAAPQIVRVSPADTALSGEVGQSFSFEVEALDPEAAPLAFEFQVNGARTAVESRFTFIPSQPGPYRVQALVSDGDRVATRSWSVTVTENVAQPPTASLTVFPDSGNAPLQVAIEASGTDPDGTVVLVEVDADGNGVYEVAGTGPASLTRQFNVAGNYRLRGRVTDDEGLVGVAEGLVRVTRNLPPRASLTITPEEGPAPLEVRVHGEGSDPDGAVVLYELDIDGDGTFEVSGPTPIDLPHVFTDYTRTQRVELRVTDDGGLQDVAAATVRPRPDVDEAASQITQDGSGRLLSDGRAGRPLTVRVMDPHGNALPGVQVELFSSRNAGAAGVVDRLSPERGLTDAAGIFQAVLTTTSSSTLLGDARIGARAGGETLAQDVTVQFVTPVSAHQSSLSCPFMPTHVVSSPFEPRQAVVTATVRDVQGRPLVDMFVELRTRDPAIWPVQPAGGRSDTAGVFRATVTSNRPNDNTFVDFYADGHKTSAICVVSFVP